MASMNSSLFPLNSGIFLPNSFAAITRSSFMAERQRENTASPMRVSGTPSSSAAMPVHLPVPFWPAVSSIFSTMGLPSVSL